MLDNTMNLKTIGLFSLLAVNCFAAPDYYNFIKSSEGIKYSIYKDSRGNKTVGVGHLMLPTDKIKASYSEKEVRAFFDKDLGAALIIARKHFPNFDSLSDDAKEIVVSLAFNLGSGGLSKFKKFKAAIANKDFTRAAKELRESNWYSQVGVRGKKYVAILNNMG
jgi:lysozyme